MSTTPIITGGSDPVSIPAGDIQFYDRFSPPLPAGAYSLTTSQSVKGVQDLTDDGQDPSYHQTQALTINGPRFALSSADVFMMYPPANHTGNFTDHVPHVVLNPRSFPWLRTMVDPAFTPPPPSTPPPNTPWIGLLTFYSQDIQRPNDPTDPNPTGPVSPPTTLAVSALFTQPPPPAPAVLTPQIVPTAAEATLQATAIDVDYAFFKGIAPAQTEAPYLSHARQVNTDGKALAGEQAKGFFSVTVSNRVVQPGDTQTAVLVSLEGHWERLPGGVDANDPANNGKKIRLVVLASWSFQAEDSPGDFLGLMKALTFKGNGGIDLLRLPAADVPGDPDTDPVSQATQALALGFVPLGNDLRIGEQTTSYYRGPCAAAPCSTDSTYGPFYYSDSTIHYDPTFGTFNLSYAAAFQIGRLLALSDGAFASDLVKWRNDYFYRVQVSLQQAAVQQPLDAAVSGAVSSFAAAAPAEDYGPTQELRSTTRRLWHGAIAAPILQGVASVPLVRPRHLRPASSSRPGVLSPEEIGDLNAAGDDPVRALQRKLAARKTH